MTKCTWSVCCLLTCSQCRTSAAVELVEAELKTRQSLPEPAGDSGTEEQAVPTRGAKRRRLYTPVEACPFCEHTYTVRDGLAQHTGPKDRRCWSPCALTAL